MDRHYLLDTNILMAYFNNDATIRRHLKGAAFSVSSIVAGELFHGILNSSSRERNVTVLCEFLAVQPLLPCDYDTAQRYGILATALSRRGETIRDNDIWIAAHALQYGLTLVSRDSDFERLRIFGLTLETW